MIKVKVVGDAKAAAQFGEAARRVSGDQLKTTIHEGLVQLQRFVIRNIEVDTGRTKNSIFARVDGGGGNSVVGMLGTAVRYAPYVRDRGHGEQFFDYAAKREGQKVANALGLMITSEVNDAFS